LAKEITILSGKGGAGKTVVTAAIASFATNAVFCDNDVDAADLHLIFKPQIKEQSNFISGNVAVINQEKCTKSGLCEVNCRFGAIQGNGNKKPVVNEFHCEGCRLCERLCPEKAIEMLKKENNSWFVSDSRFGEFVHARMGPGEENSGKLVTQVRNEAKKIARSTDAKYIINDGPPGIGCTAISSITGTDVVLLVTEPSVSGLHDLKRLFELTQSFGVSAFAVINKYDINKEITEETEQFLLDAEVPLLGKLPFDLEVVESIVNGKSMPEFAPHSKFTKEMKSVWKKLVNFGVKTRYQ